MIYSDEQLLTYLETVFEMISQHFDFSTRSSGHMVTLANVGVCSQLQQSEEAHEAEMTDLNAITEEFAVRISESEKKLQSSAKVSIISCLFHFIWNHHRGVTSEFVKRKFAVVSRSGFCICLGSIFVFTMVMVYPCRKVVVFVLVAGTL